MKGILTKEVKKVTLSLMLLTLCTYSEAKTTYLARYQNYVHIIEKGDTLVTTNNLPKIEMNDPAGMFHIGIVHEEMSEEHVKAIKRAKRAAGWAAVSATTSAISAVFSQNRLQYYLRSETAFAAAELSELYSIEANQEQHLNMIAWIDNLTDEEMMVCDMERGLVWYILPRQTLELTTHNPDLLSLRISDIHHIRVRYATIAAGSIVEKKEIAKTDGDWLLVEGIVTQDNGMLRHEYHWVNPLTYERKRLTKKEFDENKKDK